MKEQRYFIQLSYKGTNFFGWQIQPNAITVQEVLMQALTKINRQKDVSVTGCGRTDTGVHASKFYAHADFTPEIKLDTLAYKLNCMLPKDIAIQSIFPVTPDFHSRFNAKSRTYHYFIHGKKDPFLTDISWFMRQQLDLASMNKACSLLLTNKNFKCFSRPMADKVSFICDVTSAEWTKTEHGYQFTITANRFLRNMVRAIVGTMVDLGKGKINLSDFENIIASQDRKKAGKSAPAQGLFLSDVQYDFPEML